MKPIISANSVYKTTEMTEYKKGIWTPARPLFADSWLDRLKAAFGVLIGRYDAIDWGDKK